MKLPCIVFLTPSTCRWLDSIIKTETLGKMNMSYSELIKKALSEYVTPNGHGIQYFLIHMARIHNKSQFTRFRRILHEAERELDSIYMSKDEFDRLYARLFNLVNECLNLTQDV